MASKWISTACGMCYVRCGIRVKAPLKRTNPKKGAYEDPGWQEISWEEALGTIVAKLEEIRDDPKKLHIQAWEITHG